jgi:hypothetical protein
MGGWNLESTFLKKLCRAAGRGPTPVSQMPLSVLLLLLLLLLSTLLAHQQKKSTC